MELQGYVNAPQCAGINHADFALDGSFAIFTCEFNNALVKIDMNKRELVGTLKLARIRGLKLSRKFSMACPSGPEPSGSVGAFRSFLLGHSLDLAPRATGKGSASRE